MSDYIISIEDRNRLDSARKFLSDAVNDLGNESDQMIARLGLRAGNSLSQVVIALPDLNITASPDSTEESEVEGEPIVLSGGTSAGELQEVIESTLAGVAQGIAEGGP